MRSLPHPQKVFIAGNHDLLFERNRNWALSSAGFDEDSIGVGYGSPADFKGVATTPTNDLTYLENGCVTLRPALGSLRIYGSPVTPWFYDWAFNRQRGVDIAEIWQHVPSGLDVLITHGPPHGVLDTVADACENVGCEELSSTITRARPRVHAFGHIHEGYGVEESDGVLFVNAAICTREYKPTNKPIVVDVPHDREARPVVIP